jgi:prephenate dehydrogenase
MKKYTIGIIGGTGHMGQWFKRYFEKHGYDVLIAGRKTKLTPIELAKRCDIVIISVFIGSTLKVIKEVGKHIKQDGLLMDLTSLKKLPVDAMLKHSKSSVIGTHPVFGPSVKSIKNQTIVLCPARPGRWLKWLTSILEKDGAIVRITTPEKHDKMMSIVQGVTHFSTICLAHTLKELGVSVKESLHYTSPIYKLRMDMVGRLLNQDPQLYADIIMLNPENKKAIEEYIRSTRQLIGIIKRHDQDEFTKFFDQSAKFLGDFKDEAVEYSDYVIDQLVKKGKIK